METYASFFVEKSHFIKQRGDLHDQNRLIS